MTETVCHNDVERAILVRLAEQDERDPTTWGLNVVIDMSVVSITSPLNDPSPNVAVIVRRLLAHYLGAAPGIVKYDNDRRKRITEPAEPKEHYEMIFACKFGETFGGMPFTDSAELLQIVLFRKEDQWLHLIFKEGNESKEVFFQMLSDGRTAFRNPPPLARPLQHH